MHTDPPVNIQQGLIPGLFRIRDNRDVHCGRAHSRLVPGGTDGWAVTLQATLALRAALVGLQALRPVFIGRCAVGLAALL